MAAVGTLAFLAGTARADKRPVAVIDLTLSDETAELSKALLDDLGTHPELRRVPSVAYEGALLGKPPDDDAQKIGSATTSLATAEKALADYNSPAANASAESGLTNLDQVAPAAAAPIFAQLAFVRGQAQLGLKHPDEARSWFTLVHAITPNRVLDPDRFFPEVIEAYDRSRIDPSKKDATIDVKGAGEIWIDGAAYGAAPREVQIAAGRHIVQLVSLDRETRGVFAIAESGKHVEAAIPDAPAPIELQIRRTRLALAKAGDSVERASAMTRLAKLIGVGDAVLISKTNDQLMIQTWRDRAPGFSKLEPRGKRSSGEILVALAPPPPPIVPPPPKVIPLPEGPRWYQHRYVKLGAGITVTVVAVATAIAYVLSNKDPTYATGLGEATKR